MEDPRRPSPSQITRRSRTRTLLEGKTSASPIAFSPTSLRSNQIIQLLLFADAISFERSFFLFFFFSPSRNSPAPPPQSYRVRVLDSEKYNQTQSLADGAGFLRQGLAAQRHRQVCSGGGRSTGENEKTKEGKAKSIVYKS